jgi:lantibiotic modifying enzyme
LGEVPWFEALGTDEMRIVRKRVRIEDRENRPSLSGVQIKVQSYGDAIVHGFTTIYETLLQHREELLSDDGPLARFSNDQVRAVLRSTEIYTVLLRESFHPDLLHDALDRDLLVDRLWMGVTGNPGLEKLIAAERHDLLNGDVVKAVPIE